MPRSAGRRRLRPSRGFHTWARVPLCCCHIGNSQRVPLCCWDWDVEHIWCRIYSSGFLSRFRSSHRINPYHEVSPGIKWRNPHSPAHVSNLRFWICRTQTQSNYGLRLADATVAFESPGLQQTYQSGHCKVQQLDFNLTSCAQLPQLFWPTYS